MGSQRAYNNCNYFYTYILFSGLPRIVKYNDDVLHWIDKLH